MSNDPENPLIIEDCTVIYTRSKLKHNAGGSVFNMRGQGEGSGGDALIFRSTIVIFLLLLPESVGI